jgi:hypothetical protein
MGTSKHTTLIVAAAAAIACVAVLPIQPAMAQGERGKCRLGSLVDISYTVKIDARGDIEIVALTLSRTGEPKKIRTDILRIIRAGDLTRVYINHPGEEAVTEIELSAPGPHITGLKVVNPKRQTHRGHVTVLK